MDLGSQMYGLHREENKLLDQFLNRIVKQIEEYSGKNWLDECAE